MSKYNKFIIQQGSQLKSALEKMNRNSIQICFIVDENSKLVGSLSDGDIRRAFLNNAHLDSLVDDFMFKSPRFVYQDSTQDMILNTMKKYQIKYLPILTAENELIHVAAIDELLGIVRRENTVVLMAGGQGVRLRPLTLHTPKPLIKICDVPILERIIRDFIAVGFYKFIISVNYLSEKIIEYFGDGEKWGIEIEYIKEDKQMGTCGSLSLIKNKINSDFIVMNGDIVSEVNYLDVISYLSQCNADALMCAKEYSMEVPYGALAIKDNLITNIVEKPKETFYINAGIYCFKPTILEFLPENQYFDMPNLFNLLIENKKKVVPFIFKNYWSDVGQIEDFHRTESYLRGR